MTELRIWNSRYEESFWRKVQPSGSCWEWTAAKAPYGHGRFTSGTKRTGQQSFQAHRLAYLLLVGEIPAGLELDHLCRNTACVNPDHLEPVPPYVNNMRSWSAAAVNSRKTECKRGHPFDEENTRLLPPIRGRAPARSCRQCMRDYARERKRRLSAERRANYEPLL